MRSFTAIIALLAGAAATAASPTDRPPALEYTARALKDEVHDLPGAPANPGFRQFAGYIDVGHSYPVAGYGSMATLSYDLR